jgi:hypothetical protein
LRWRAGRFTSLAAGFRLGVALFVTLAGDRHQPASVGAGVPAR